MISKEEIQNLAELARLKLTEEETASLQKDISNILDYVGQLSASKGVSADKEASTDHPLMTYREGDASLSAPLVHNVMREDLPRLASGKAGTPHASDDTLAGKEESLKAAFPKRESGYNVVRKIIQKDE